MKQTPILLVFLCLLMCANTATAQVEKQVEVTKDYVPQIEQSNKLPIRPDLTDTTRMRPEIDYTITPLACNTTLEVRPIRPATMSYWEFNRPTPFYLKAGAGYPLHSVVDFRASTQRPESGYLLAKLDHRGRWADLRNDFGVKRNAQQMENTVGGAAGKYFGRYTLEASLTYDQMLRHRHGIGAPDLVELPEPLYTRIGADDIGWALRFGNHIHDTKRVDFEVVAHGNFFFDRTRWLDYDPARQTDLGAHMRLGWSIKSHRFALQAGYEGHKGARAIADYRQHLIRAGVRYARVAGMTDFEVGVDYVHDRIDGAQSAENYLLPYARIRFDLGTSALHPFIEADGSVEENSYRSLFRQSPWVTPATMLDKSSVSYNGRVGLRGTVWRNRLTYRLYAGASLCDHHNYWLATGRYDATAEDFSLYALSMLPLQGRQTAVSFHGEVEFHPVSALRIDLGAHGYIRHDDLTDQVSRDLAVGNGMADFQGNASIRYGGSRFSAQAEVVVTSARHWSMIDPSLPLQDAPMVAFKAPAFTDLRLQIEGKVAPRVVLFVEGENLLNQRRYMTAWVRDYGICATLGVKVAF